MVRERTAKGYPLTKLPNEPNDVIERELAFDHGSASFVVQCDPIDQVGEGNAAR